MQDVKHTLIQTMIEIGGRWESLDPLSGLRGTSHFILQGQKDIRFLLNMIEAKDSEIEAKDSEIESLHDDVDNLRSDLLDLADRRGLAEDL